MAKERASVRRSAAPRSDDWDGRRRSFGGLLAIASRELVRELHPRLEAAGFADVRPGSGNVFESIGTDGSTVAAMAERARITPQAMVQIVDYLEAHGLAERVPDPKDRRAKVVRLTERGRAADRAGRDSLRAIEAEWSRLLGGNRFAELRSALEDLAAALDARAREEVG